AGTLPGGVTFVDNHNGTATLSGFPAAGSAGTYTLTFTASNGVSPNATQTFTLTVTSAGFAPAFTDGPPPSPATAGTAYALTYTATGSPAPTFRLTAGAFPPGLTLSTAGVLSGTPTAGGVFTGTVTASNGVAPDATQNFSITVNKAPAFTSAAA